MTIQGHLDHFLQEYPDVSLVAFGDLASGLVLKWSAKAHCPRETLDLMGAKAASGFDTFADLMLSPGEVGSAEGAFIMHFTETSLHISARRADNSEDLVCVACAPGSQIEPLVSAAMTLADRIASVQ